ncbi:MAG: hypothetical protein IT427_04505 [Pirellulales bacterium]|nr:hypothetical protein [Pirellulales bacterium]
MKRQLADSTEMNRLQTSASVFAGVLWAVMPGMPLCAATATWPTPDLDTWVYKEANQPGSRTEAPSWFNTNLVVDPITGQFHPQPGNDTDPARLGSVLFAFNSASRIMPGLAPSRYQITSATMTASCIFYGQQPALYENQPVTNEHVVAEFANNNVTWQKPVELYGVGLAGGYTGYEFGQGFTVGPPLLDEITHPYYVGGHYNVLPIVGSSSIPGAYVDVSNSVTGGFSATEPGNVTVPFTPTPWAIGTANLPRGDPLPTISTFTFTIDLDAAGAKLYLQQSLANGAVAFIVSSLHATTDYGGSGVYPSWYTKESNVPAALMPQLVIDYQILPAGVPGDYNGNGVVDAADYVLWRNGGPLQNEVDDLGSVTAQDYNAWRARFGNTAAASASLGGGAPIPEPATIVVALLWSTWSIATARNRRV